jgi:hypothetical protein
MEIVQEEISEEVSFFDMDPTEQEAFLENWAILEAEQLSEKILLAPEIEEVIQAENEAIESVLGEELVSVKGGQSYLKDKKVFFSKLQDRLAENEKQQLKEIEETPATKLINFSDADRKIPYTKMRSALRSYARVGDFLLALPMHNNPYIYLDVAFGETGNNPFAVGHAGIITKIPDATVENTEITVAARSNGVRNETLQYWSYKSYIAGIQKVKWVWKWRGFKSGLYREVTPVSNPALLASWGNSFKGRPYVHWYEFLTAKWAAPSRFTCTTLVWWCSNKAYDINVSEWYKTMVTPSGLYSDESVYIRCNVQ